MSNAQARGVTPTTGREEDPFFTDHVQELTAKYVMLWTTASATTPQFTSRYSHRHKLKKERELDRVLERLPQSPWSFESISSERGAEFSQKVRSLLLRSLSEGETGPYSAFFKECEEAGETFVHQARDFDPSLSESDIRQALRNLWVYNSIQLYLGTPIGLTPSAFAYSLLYPYTDNWLDSPDTTPDAKTRLMHWVTRRLEGPESSQDHPPSEKISVLLDEIEREFPRLRYPDVYRSLQAIHNAQIASVQLCGPHNGDEVARLMITFRKGGTSVLADGYLVTGELTPEQRDVLFGYGVLLQLVDDLRDLDEDLAAGYSSPFSRAVGDGALDRATNQLWSFLAAVVNGTDGDRDSGGRGLLAQLVARSCTVLIQEAVAQYQTFYKAGYVKIVEESAPVSFSYLKKLREAVRRNQASLLTSAHRSAAAG